MNAYMVEGMNIVPREGMDMKSYHTFLILYYSYVHSNEYDFSHDSWCQGQFSPLSPVGCDQPFVYGNELHYGDLRSKFYSFLQTLKRFNAHKLSSRVGVASESLTIKFFDDKMDGEAQ